jgi:hypothetical protein
MAKLEEFTGLLVGVVIVVSPLLNVYFITRLATTKTRKVLAIAIGLGLYVLFMLLMYSWIYINP